MYGRYGGTLFRRGNSYPHAYHDKYGKGKRIVISSLVCLAEVSVSFGDTGIGCYRDALKFL